MDPLAYLQHSTLDSNNLYPQFCSISPHNTFYVHPAPSAPDSFNSGSKLHPTLLLAASGPYPSPPLTGSALAHTVSLPHLSNDKPCSQEPPPPLGMQQQHSLPHVPISPPPTLPITALALPLDSDENGPFISSTSSSHPSPEIVHDPLQSEGSESLALQLPSPWTPANWLTVSPSPLTMSNDHDDLPWEDDRRTPQPLCAEPTHSVWSPESPPHRDELGMISTPSSPSSSTSSWSSELSSDNDSTWDDNWMNPLSPHWAHSRGSDIHDDCCIHRDFLTPFRSPQYGPSDPKAFAYPDYSMEPADDDLSEDEQGLLRSPVSSLRRCSSLPGWDDDSNDLLLAPQSPSRRTLLHDLDADDAPPRSPGILTLPGAENDELPDLNLVSPLPGTDIDIFPNDNMFYGLGLSLSPSISIGSPSPELANSKDLLSDFPELAGYPHEIPNDLSVSVSHPAYDVVRLLRLCRKSKQAERDARRQETQLGERVANISTGLLPPMKMDAIPRRNMLRELHTAVEMRGEARKVRKREKEKWKEVRSWLRLKLEELARERASHDQGIDGVPGGASDSASVFEVEDLGKKWMMNDMGQLVAKMMFRRRDTARPLANRKMADVANEYVRSPLATPVHTATEGLREDNDVDEILDEMQGIIAFESLPLEDIEMPLLSD